MRVERKSGGESPNPNTTQREREDVGEDSPRAGIVFRGQYRSQPTKSFTKNLSIDQIVIIDLKNWRECR